MRDKFHDEKMEEQARIANPEKTISIEGFDPKNPEHIEALFGVCAKAHTEFMEEQADKLGQLNEAEVADWQRRIDRWNAAVARFTAKHEKKT